MQIPPVDQRPSPLEVKRQAKIDRIKGLTPRDQAQPFLPQERRRKGDRRKQNQAVLEERRKGDRRMAHLRINRKLQTMMENSADPKLANIRRRKGRFLDKKI